MTNCPCLTDLTGLPTSSPMPQYPCLISVSPEDACSPAVRPRVRSANTGPYDPNDAIGRSGDLWRRAVLETHVSRTIENVSPDDFSPHQRMMKPPSTEMDWPVT